MSIHEPEIENLLRHAPRPAPPADLKSRLMAQAKSSIPASRSPSSVITPAGWLRRWWPALAPGAISLACAVVLALQQIEIRDLRKSIQVLSQATNGEASQTTRPVQENVDTSPVNTSDNYEREIERLKQLAAQLSAEVAQLERMQTDNERLRARISPHSTGLPPELASAAEEMAKARERAESIGCVNNLKQFGLAARIWALDNGHVLPTDMRSMSNQLSTPKILICPADTARQAAKDWASFSAANSSYEYLAPSGSTSDPTRVLARCPIHGNIGLCDGSVQRGAAKDHPEWFIQRNGKLYMERREPNR